ncbi:HIT family protein [Clostridium estertheticum]|uniref:HIT family hydrolase n=1 Tax=Clostridium estertheticum subsp. estertheticum TaxID=1552 RepID=A0A1J0GFV4_9CLOT|nr:HIT family protein [Clostridium estertheticum]APC39856.1 HIT family hydrolase [Clostridium estertheticum subsp. estertheticum]MBU3072665.1 HIT family protein [Clostridium estertheticum]MBU3162758.1 HIT family protein [Clostridium estertheticum]MBX4260823.1 HIT family protein [Clostridium estertheticum]MBZ9614089.1 HIT family protein [Clostridium estertheticum subsp. laramiense]
MSECIFCNINESEIIVENRYAVAILDHFPVNNGHCLIITKRHFANFFEATEEEIKAIYKLLHEVKEMFDIQYEPAGYNIGINVGTYAGQTINHLHVHLIPRYIGDVDDPRGGVRNLKESLVEYDG